MIVNRLERVSSGGYDKGMMKKPHAKADKVKINKSAGGKYGAHLASYRTVAGAKRGWRSLSRKFSKELDGLDFGTTEFDAGDGKGTYVRLVAVSFKSKASAKKFCRTLKAKRQFCKATRAKP